MIEAVGLGYRVGDADLVSEVDLEVRSGELVAVVGPNGAGKSTLLRLVSGDLRPTDGLVYVDGERVAEMHPSEIALRRSVLGQKNPTDVPFTVRAVVSLGRHPHRRDPDNSDARDREAVEDALGRTDVTHLGERIFATLSGGEQTRVSLARVLAQDAPAVLLDEPTTALDVAHQERIMAVAAGLAVGGRAVLVVLHDLNAAARYADRVVVMTGGRIVAEGVPAEVFTEELLSEVYRQPMRVIDHPYRPGPLVLVVD
ncbi:MAG TPA: heme ABC transporter ATP-binding protein [Acidimicrobiia bacterium]|nr:heme ABC transporter ATP-binding protein [Acidimicrobiia bacterium]